MNPIRIWIFGAQWVFEDGDSVRDVERLLASPDPGDQGAGQLLLMKKFPGIIEAFARAKRELALKKIPLEKVIVKGNELKPFPPEKFVDPLPFAYSEKFEVAAS